MPPLQRRRALRPVIDLGDDRSALHAQHRQGPAGPAPRQPALAARLGADRHLLLRTGRRRPAGGDRRRRLASSCARPSGRQGDAGEASVAAAKGDRFRPVPQAEVARRVIQISTVTRAGRPRHRARASFRACAHQSRRTRGAGCGGARPLLQPARHLRRGQRRVRSPARWTASDPSTAPRWTARWRSRSPTSPPTAPPIDETAELAVHRGGAERARGGALPRRGRGGARLAPLCRPRLASRSTAPSRMRLQPLPWRSRRKTCR